MDHCSQLFYGEKKSALHSIFYMQAVPLYFYPKRKPPHTIHIHLAYLFAEQLWKELGYQLIIQQNSKPQATSLNQSKTN